VDHDDGDVAVAVRRGLILDIHLIDRNVAASAKPPRPGAEGNAFDSPPIKKLPWLAMMRGFLSSLCRLALSSLFCAKEDMEPITIRRRMDLQCSAFMGYFVSLKMSSTFARTRTATGIAS
jgi:hypothetical protein